MNSQKTKFSVLTYTIKELFENMQYIEIPLYQRKYNWDKEQVIPLIEDIISRNDDNNEHYFGVIAKSTEKFVDDKKEVIKNRIIDGQQRITTSIIIIHFLLCKKYEFDRDAGVKGGFKSEFQDVNFSNEIETSESKSLGNITSVKPEFVVMSGRVKEVYEIIENYFLESNEKVSFEFYDSLLDTFINKFKIASLDYIIERSEEMLVFENLNSKGSPLAEFDLIRNSIISIETSKEEGKESKYYLQQFNSNVIQMLKTGIFERSDSKVAKTFENFLETYLTWKMGQLKTFKTYKLYRNFKIYIEENDISFDDLIKELKKFLSLYLTVDSKEKDQIGSKLWFRVIDNKDVHYPYIFALFNKYGIYDEIKSTWKSEEIIIKYMRVLASHLIKLMSVTGTGQSFGGLIRDLKNMVEKNKSFNEIKNYLSSGEDVKNGTTPESKAFIISCQKIQTQRWIPESIIDIIENSVNDLNESVNYNGRTLEHIMPQKPKNPAWPIEEFNFNQNHNTYLNQIGNLVFLNGKKNTSAGRKSFHDKNTEYYQHSISPLITSLGIKKLPKVTEQLEWTFKTIEDRTEILAEKAAEILE